LKSICTIRNPQTISFLRWVTAVGLGLCVLAAKLPEDFVWANPKMIAFKIGFVAIAIGCIRLGGRIAVIIGFVLLASGLCW
jgi:hypothetical protein